MNKIINKENLEENENIMEVWHPLKFNDNMDYIPSNLIFKIFSNMIYYGVAYPVLKILLKILYDLKIEGKENLRQIKTGAISVSNHVLILDCGMIAMACGFKKIYYTTQQESFQIPLVKHIVRLLRAIPISHTIHGKKKFKEAINKLLKEKSIVHFYPEHALHPYCKRIRNFKSGAFKLAIENEVPIIPIVIKFRKPKWVMKFLKTKDDVTLYVLDPIDTANYKDKGKDEMEKLKHYVYGKMSAI